MSTDRIRVVIATLSLVIMTLAFIQPSYSQQPTSNSSLGASGTLKMGLGLGENVSSDVGFATNNQTASGLSTSLSAMKYEAAREQLLKVWDTLQFEPRVATFVNESAAIGNGQYQQHSNIFNPGETIVLYVQPIGFGHKQIQGQNGEKLYSMNFTADIVLSTKNGTIIGEGQDIPLSQLISHYRNTELFSTLTLTVPKDSHLNGDYVCKYTLRDQTTGKSFEISKDVTIA